MEVVKKFPETMDARTEYKLVKAPAKRMSDAVDSVLEVKSWLLASEADTVTGEPKEILTIETNDGELFSTISSPFMREFADIVKFFGDDVGAIKVIERVSRAGRKYLICVIE